MRCYLIQAPGAKRYAGTQADARTARQALVDDLGCKKAEVTIDEVEVPTTKNDLLGLLNDLCKEG